jgi:hypothetical protein
VTEPADSPINVVYIAGETRSGTTIVDRILGTLDGVTSLCELYYVWDAGYANDDYCSCGQRFSACDFWQRVTAAAFGSDGPPRTGHVLRERVIRSRDFPRLYTGTVGRQISVDLEQYRRWLGQLYRGLREVTGCNTFIDSSKYPSGALVLEGVPGLAVHVLHVVRDPRGFVYSMQKGNYNPGFDGRMAVRSPASSLTGWVVRNLFCESLGRRMPYVRLAYDEMARAPRTQMQRVVDAITPLAGKQLPFLDERRIDLPMIHTIGGNPHRFRCGVTEISPDDEWRDKLDPAARRTATAMCYPLLSRYGIPV